MDKKILKLAKRKFKELSKRYDGFINLIVDDWRGYRFIFDTKDVRGCNNDCLQCPLFLLLRKEGQNIFSAGLYKATKEDKLIFGFQNYLNCKTLNQYKECYVNFLLKKNITENEIKEELELIKSSRIIFSKEKDNGIIEDKFKKSIIKDALIRANKNRRNLLNKYI